MTEHRYRIVEPPPSGVEVGDQVWIPVFCDAPVGWIVVQSAYPVIHGQQRVRGIRITPPYGDVEVTLPLGRAVRRVEDTQ